MQPGEEQGMRKAGISDLVAEGPGDAFDEPVLVQAAEIAGYSSPGVMDPAGTGRGAAP